MAAPIISKEYKSKVGTNQTPLYFYTSTEVVQGSDGKVTGGKTTLNYSPTPNTYVPAATTSDGGKTWTYLKDSNGKDILGDDAKISLEKGSLKTDTNKAISSAAASAGIVPVQAKSLQLNQNTADPFQPGQAEQFKLEDATKSIDQLREDLGQAIEDSKTIRTEYGNWKYPLEFPTNQDRITFTMFRYNPRSFDVSNAATNLQVFGNRQLKDRFGTVTLPISPTITDVNSADWGSDTMNALEALAAAASYGAIRGGAAGAVKAAGDIAKGLEGAGDALKSAAAAYFAGQAAGGNKTFFSRITGGVLNPNLELLFNGPQLRTFSFSFTLSAREEKESKEIRNIIRFFKQGMSVKRASTNLFLKAPNIFDISYHYRDNTEDHPWINKIKTCALTSCQVNYTPAGNYATYYDGSMTSYELTLSFSELDPIFEDDYDNPRSFGTPDTSIGY